jgi:hypothetical protein
VIIDSLKRITKGSPVSENSAEFADNIYSIKETLTRYGASGVLIHHTSKNPELLGVYQVRGSSAISGAVWGHLLLHPIPRKDPEQKNKLKVDPADPMRVLAVHARDSSGQELRIELNPENSSWINHGQIGEANAAEQQSLKLRVLKVLAKNSHRAWTGREIIDLLGMSPEEGRGIYTTLNRLVERREINCSPSPTGRGQVYSATDPKPLPPPPPLPTDLGLNSKVESTDITSFEPIQQQFNNNSTTHSTPEENTPVLNRPNDVTEGISAVEFNNIPQQGGEGVEETAVASSESQPTTTELAHIELTDGETVAQSLVSNNEVQASLFDTPTVPTENTSQPALPIYRRSDGGFVVDPWLDEENLQAMAEALAQCESREQLDLLRQCWLPQAMNLACQRLSPEKHAQIQQWVIELNESVVTTDL